MQIQNIKKQFIYFFFYIPQKIYNIYVFYVLWLLFFCIAFFNARAEYTLVNIILFIFVIYLFIITLFLFFYKLNSIIHPYHCLILFCFSIACQSYFITDINHICHKNWILLVEGNFPLDNTSLIFGLFCLIYIFCLIFYIFYTDNKKEIKKVFSTSYEATTDLSFIKNFRFMIPPINTGREYKDIKKDFKNIPEYIKGICFYSIKIIINVEPSLVHIFGCALIFAIPGIINETLKGNSSMESVFFSIQFISFCYFIFAMLSIYTILRIFAYFIIYSNTWKIINSHRTFVFWCLEKCIILVFFILLGVCLFICIYYIDICILTNEENCTLYRIIQTIIQYGYAAKTVEESDNIYVILTTVKDTLILGEEIRLEREGLVDNVVDKIQELINYPSIDSKYSSEILRQVELTEAQIKEIEVIKSEIGKRYLDQVKYNCWSNKIHINNWFKTTDYEEFADIVKKASNFSEENIQILKRFIKMARFIKDKNI